MPGCQLSGEVPQCISGLQMLATVDFGTNQLTGSVYAFFQLPNLQSLDVSENQLDGIIPSPHRISDISFLSGGVR